MKTEVDLSVWNRKWHFTTLSSSKLRSCLRQSLFPAPWHHPQPCASPSPCGTSMATWMREVNHTEYNSWFAIFQPDGLHWLSINIWQGQLLKSAWSVLLLNVSLTRKVNDQRSLLFNYALLASKIMNANHEPYFKAFFQNTLKKPHNLCNRWIHFNRKKLNHNKRLNFNKKCHHFDINWCL